MKTTNLKSIAKVNLHSAVTAVCFVLVAGWIVNACPTNSDARYDRHQMLEQFASELNKAIPYSQPRPTGFYVKDEKPGAFFVYDLTDPANTSLSSSGCVDFIERHVYHFTSSFLPDSKSHIAVLENGVARIFRSVNCSKNGDSFGGALAYLAKALSGTKNASEVMIRVKNYRRYGSYFTDDSYKADCEEFVKTKVGESNLYDRKEVFGRFADELYANLSKNVEYYESIFPVQNSTPVGFFVYDLTDPTNRQISAGEYVRLIDQHIYHFAWIDLPYSYSNIAFLDDGKIKIFRSVNCSGRGSSLGEVIRYIRQKLKAGRDRNEVIKRVRNFRNYGVYASFNGESVVRCSDIGRKAK